jgi:hypothetical protein
VPLNTNGKHHMASFEAKGSLAEIHDRLLQNGLEHHTLEPTDGGARVHVFAEDQDTIDGIDRAAGSAAVTSIPGNGEFIGTKLETAKSSAPTPSAPTTTSSTKLRIPERWVVKDPTSEEFGRIRTIIGVPPPAPTTASGSSARKATRR